MSATTANVYGAFNPQEVSAWAKTVGLRLVAQRYVDDMDDLVRRLRDENKRLRVQLKEVNDA